MSVMTMNIQNNPQVRRLQRRWQKLRDKQFVGEFYDDPPEKLNPIRQQKRQVEQKLDDLDSSWRTNW